MDFINKFKQISASWKTGGNFKFIALNMATIYNAICQNDIGKKYSENERMSAMSLCDMYQYLMDGDTDPYEVVGYTKNALKRIGNGSDVDKITEITIEMEYLIFATLGKFSDEVIRDCINKEYHEIRAIIEKTLCEPDSSIIKDNVYKNVYLWLEDKDFNDILEDAIISVWSIY